MESSTTIDSTFSFHSIISEIEINAFLKEKNEALLSLELEDESFSKCNSSYSDDMSNLDEDHDDIVIISSRTNTQFTERLNDKIKELAKQEYFNQIKMFAKQ